MIETQKKCEGACGRHEGAARMVRVRHIASGHDWGKFWYCDAAIAEDISRGHEVSICDHDQLPRHREIET